MKAIYKFDLNNEDDREDHKIFFRSKDLYFILIDFKNFLRTQNKHGINEKITTREQMLEYLDSKFYELMDEYNLLDVFL